VACADAAYECAGCDVIVTPAPFDAEMRDAAGERCCEECAQPAPFVHFTSGLPRTWSARAL
jgi:hypothetical protein